MDTDTDLCELHQYVVEFYKVIDRFINVFGAMEKFKNRFNAKRTEIANLLINVKYCDPENREELISKVYLNLSQLREWIIRYYRPIKSIPEALNDLLIKTQSPQKI